MFLDGSRRLLPENVRLLHFMCEGKANWRFPFFFIDLRAAYHMHATGKCGRNGLFQTQRYIALDFVAQFKI